jgi:hypothetical protein
VQPRDEHHRRREDQHFQRAHLNINVIQNTEKLNKLNLVEYFNRTSTNFFKVANYKVKQRRCAISSNAIDQWFAEFEE